MKTLAGMVPYVTSTADAIRSLGFEPDLATGTNYENEMAWRAQLVALVAAEAERVHSARTGARP